MKSILLASLVALICSGALAKPITAVVRLNERTPVEHLAYYTRIQTTPMIRHYSALDIRKISAPGDQDYQNLLAVLRDKGFKITNESPTHLWVTIQGDSALFTNVFNTHFEYLNDVIHRNDGHFTVPEDLKLIAGMVGLDNTRKAHPHYKRVTGTHAMIGGGISPENIRKYYGLQPLYDQGLSGKGQHIAIATYDGFDINNVKYYYQALKLTPGPTVDQIEFNGTPTYDDSSAGETVLDAELTAMIAPGSNVHVFASSTNDDAGEAQMFTAILDDNRAKVVNYSWGNCERDLDPNHKIEMDKIFARAVAQGVNIFVASGDSGSDSCQDHSVAADWPAGHSNIVAVGGTSLHIRDNSNETAWSGSGGGVSGFYALPDWQNGLDSKFQRRTYPDVSFNADPYTGQAIWTGNWEVIGGTSMAAPQWAGFLALVNEARTKNNMGTLGFLNPIIYGFSDQDRAEAFNDITSGKNGAYRATVGYDAVTGFGSMHGDVLLQKLMR